MITGGSTFLYASDMTQLLDNSRFKISSLVTMQTGRKTIMHEKIVIKDSCCSLDSLISSWNGPYNPRTTPTVTYINSTKTSQQPYILGYNAKSIRNMESYKISVDTQSNCAYYEYI